jgi:integrase
MNQNPTTLVVGVCQKHFKIICAKIGLPASLKLHNLRDDYTTARVERGDSIEAISADLDHESITTTMGYIHETYEQKRKAALDVERDLHFPEPLAKVSS